MIKADLAKDLFAPCGITVLGVVQQTHHMTFNNNRGFKPFQKSQKLQPKKVPRVGMVSTE